MQIRTLIFILLFSGLTLTVRADSLSDARAAYEKGDYARAAQLFEAATREQGNAMSYYGLGLSSLKLRRYDAAVRALETAQQKDPSLKFARSPEFFQQRLREAREGAARSGANNGSPRFSPDDHLNQVLGDLAAGKALMDYTGTLTPADMSALQQIINDARSRGFNLRIYLIKPGRSMRTRDFAMREARKYLNLGGNDILVIASQEGVYATGARGSSELDTSEINRAASEAAPYFRRSEPGRTGFGLGLEQFSRLLVGEARADRTTRRGIFGGLGVILLGLIAAPIIFIIGRRKMQQQAFKKKLDQAINLLMNDINDHIGQEFDVNARFVNWQSEYQEIKRENNWKDHTKIDRLIAALEDAVRQPERYFDYKPGIKEIKEAAAKLGAPAPPQRSSDDVFDYFDGRPLKKDEAVVVSLRDRNGQEVRVLTSREHAEQMAQGNAPKVLTREVNGQQVHWSNDPTFDPYRDYRPYYGGPNWVDLWLMSQLFSPHSYYGYGIFPYYHQDFYYAPPYVDRSVTDFPGYNHWDGSSGIDFGSTPNYERYERERQWGGGGESTENSGGLDFSLGGGSSDNSSSWGGGSDFGNSNDSWGGGSDFGSSDSGGGDWGGGSDFGSDN